MREMPSGPSTRSKREKENFPMQQALILSSLEMHRAFNMRINVYMFFRQTMRTSSAG